MSEFISVLDILENAPYGAQTAVRDEVAVMESDIRRYMDQGLTPDDMKTAKEKKKKEQAAASILEKILV